MEWLASRFELSRGGASSNLRSMEGLRGLAAFLVFLVHYASLIKPYASWELDRVQRSFLITGQTGVDLFFVLSGFLIYGSLVSRAQPFLPYMRRRIQRIYPALVPVFLAYIVLSRLFPGESKIPAGLGPALAYLGENFLLLPGLFRIRPMIDVTWSLSYEMFFYWMVPLLVAGFALRRRRPVLRMALFGFLAALLVLVAGRWGDVPRMVMFLAGMILYEAIKVLEWPAPPPGLGLAALAAGIVCTLWVEGAAKACLLFATFLTACFACFGNPSGWLARGFSWRGIRWFGNMSYSYYLWHVVAMKGAFLALSKVLPIRHYGPGIYWVLLAPMFLATLVPAVAAYLLVERPFSLMAGKAKPRPAQAPAAVAALGGCLEVPGRDGLS